MSDSDLRAAMAHDRYPRSGNYDPEWVIANQMGPNALWLVEALTEVMPVAPGTRVLDLGCGRAMSSIFLAREFGAEIWATDLWIDATSNRKRIEEAGVEDRVFPIHAEAHDLPYADEFFDAIVSVDAYHYFGTDDMYLPYITKFLRSGGRLGIVVPAIFEEFGEDLPEHLEPYRASGFHGADWWRTLWAQTKKVTVDVADHLPEGWQDWLRWSEITGRYLEDEWAREFCQKDLELLQQDQGELVGFARVVATKR